MSKFVPPATDRLGSIAQALAVIAPSDLAIERDLNERKWFGYRFMSPLHATMEFGRIYREKLKDYVRTNIDLSQSQSMADFVCRVPEMPERQFSHLWKARQFADQFPIPYETYLAFCFEFAEARKRKMAPRPNQLRPNPKTAEAWHEKFERFLERQENLFLYRVDLPPQFLTEHYHGLPAQDDLRTFIRGTMSTYPRALHLEIELWDEIKRVLPRSFFATFNSSEMMQSAEEIIQSDRDAGRIIGARPPVVSLKDQDFLPSCYGVPYANDAYASSCLSCQFRASCSAASHDLLVSRDAPSDLEDAENERKRKMTRERVQKHRMLKKNPALMAAKEAQKKYSKDRRLPRAVSGSV